MTAPKPVYVLRLKDGTVYDGLVLGADVRKTLDRRSDRDVPQIVYEVRRASGTWFRVWTDELESVGADLV